MSFRSIRAGARRVPGSRLLSGLAAGLLLLTGSASPLFARPLPDIQLVPTITMVAGGGSNPVNGGVATSTSITQVHGVAVDRAGNIYLSSQSKNQIWKVDTTGNISVIAGAADGSSGPATNGLASQATFNQPSGLAIDAAGNLYIADKNNYALRKIDTNGNITTIAGGSFGSTGDGGPAVQATLSQIEGVAVDGAGNIYIADTGSSKIRKIDTDGNISTVAGNGEPGYLGDGNAATSAELSGPRGVAVDADGNIFIADTGNNLIREVNVLGTISTVAGHIVPPPPPPMPLGSIGDGGPATSATLNTPYYVAVDANGNIYIADSYNNEIRQVDGSGTITAFAGTGSSGYPTAGGQAAAESIGTPMQIAFDVQGNLYFSNLGDSEINKVGTDSNTYFPTTLATAATGPLGGGSGIPGSSVTMNVALRVNYNTVLKSINLSNVDTDTSTGGIGGVNFTVGEQSGCFLDGVNTTLAGTVCTVPVTFTPEFPGQQSAPLVVTDVSGNKYSFGLVGYGKGSVLGFSPATFAQNVSVLLTDPQLSSPGGIAVDGIGEIYVADTQNARVIKSQAFGGSIGPESGESGESVVNTGSITLIEPTGVAVDAAGDLYISDYGLPTVTKVTPAGVATSLYAGGLTFSNASGVAVDKAGNVFVADKSNNRIVEITAQGVGIVINTGSYTLSGPEGVAVDAFNNLYIADTFNSRVIKVAANGTASLLSTGDIVLGHVGAIAVDTAGDVYVSNISIGQGEIIEIPASGSPFVVNTKQMGVADVQGIALDGISDLYFTDSASGALNVMVQAAVIPAQLAFADTAVGSMSSDSPQVVKVQNLGNTPLTFTTPETGSNPSYPAGFPADSTDTNLCASGATLAVGGVCNVSVNFSPTEVGTNSGFVTLADDMLNQSVPSQMIMVTGNGLVSVDHFTVVPTTSTLTAGSNFNITVTALKADGSVSTSYTGTVQFTSTDAQAGLPDSYTFVAGDNGVHTFNVTLKTAGQQTVTATDSATSTALGTSDSITVSAGAPSSFTAVSNATPSAIIGGYLSDMQVKLIDQYNNPIPNATVTFTSPASGASTSKASVAEETSDDGVATYFAVANGIVGSYQVVATTDGISTPVTFNANNTADSTTTVVAANPSDSVIYGQSVTLTATVTPGIPQEPSVVSGRGGLHPMMSIPTTIVGPATGTVTFYDGTRVLGTATLGGNAGVSANSRGLHANNIVNNETTATATLTITAPVGGTHSYTATYAGDANFTTSATLAPLTYQVAPATVVIAGPTTQPVSANPGQSATIPVTVTGVAGAALPTGTINYQIGDGEQQQATVTAGQATLQVPSTLTQGNYTISMTYTGDDNYQPVLTPVAISLNEVTPDYSLTANPSSLTLRNGQTGVVNFTFTPVGGYTGTVNFACSGLPVGVTCSFAPPSLTANGSNTVQTSVLTITTQGPNHGTVGPDVKGGTSNIAMTSVFFLPGMFFGAFLIWERKRLPMRARQLLLVVVMVSTISGMIGCGTSPRTAPGTNAVTVTATASATGGGGALSHTATFTLIVTN